MGFPWNFEETFEGGTKGNFDSESDTGNRLDFPGPAELAADGQGVAPFRGAYCMRVNLGKNATDAYLQELDGFDAAAGVTRHIRLMLCRRRTPSSRTTATSSGSCSSRTTAPWSRAA